MRLRTCFVVPIMVAVTACSGAESETPVDLQPGRYEVTIANSSSRFGPRSEQKSLCFTPEHARNFSSQPLKGLLPSGSGCETTAAERKGNAFSGARQCNSEIGDGMKFDAALKWEGRMAADSFHIDLDISMKGIGGGPGSGDLRTSVSVEGKRTGEC